MKTLILAVALLLAAGRTADTACELQCSIVYTREVRACEHQPECLRQAHQKYDACVEHCGGKK